jgi:hypothetical protein
VSNFIPGKRKLLNKIAPGGTGGKILRGHDVGYHIGNGLSNAMTPKMPDVEIPAAPTIDDAQRNRDQQDRLRRRRGVLANIYAGGGATTGSSSTLG